MKRKKYVFLYVIFIMSLLLSSYRTQLLDMKCIPVQQTESASDGTISSKRSYHIEFGTYETEILDYAQTVSYVSNQMSSNKRVNRSLLEYLHLTSISTDTDKIFQCLDVQLLNESYPSNQVAVYIHQSDGKKRI